MRILKTDERTNEVRLIPENLEDLWHVERVLSAGDVVQSKSFRRFKTEKEGDSGEKKEVAISLVVEKVEFAKLSNKLRLTGKINAGHPEEFVTVGSYHTIDVEPGYPVSIFKDWQDYQIKRLKSAIEETKRPRLAIVAMDEGKALFSTVLGYGINYDFEIENKARKRDSDFEKRNAAFYAEVALALAKKENVGKIVVAGPGFAKDNLKKYLEQKNAKLLKKITFESCSNAEHSGINELLKGGLLAKVAEGERIEKEMKLIERLMAELGRESGLAIYGLANVRGAVEASAVEELLVLDEVLRTRKEVEKIMIEAERKKTKITIFSHEADAGKQLGAFGGLAAVLRYRIN
jgi:protein pelota